MISCEYTIKVKETEMEDYYIIRARGAGVFFGNIRERDGGEVTMTNARRIYYWSGATELCQLAAEGVKDPDNCKFTMTVDEVILLDVVEIQKCTCMAEESLRGVKVWKI